MPRMRKLTPATALIHCHDRAKGQSLAAALQSRGNQVWDDSKSIPQGCSIDLLVIDQPQAIAELTKLAGWMDWQAGVVVISDEPEDGQFTYDAWLPTAADERQVLLVCELVGEIARLRRRCRQGGRQRRLLGHLAMTDPLTGLPNRWAWEEEIRRRTELAGQTSQPLCIVLLDLDEFKKVNDSFGHSRGDAVLRAAAHELMGQLRQDDFVARLGGDEFGLLLFVDSPESAASVVERVRSGVAVESANDEWITASAGFAVYQPSASADFSRAYNEADQALHDAKRGGRQRSISSWVGETAK
jgi:diguanylate cyclase (GGDEF)-like protein